MSSDRSQVSVAADIPDMSSGLKELLLEAVDRLESMPHGSGSSSTSTVTAPMTPAVQCSSQSAAAELQQAFRFPRSRSRFGRSYKRSSSTCSSCSSTCSSKKKKIKTWTHTFVCLSKTDHDEIPNANERATLKLAGLGEKRLTVHANATALELQGDLLREFPKLEHGGGHEMLRATDGGGKDLIPIVMPSYGYTVEYLQAIVKSGKIYIRPIQRNLDDTPKDEVHTSSCVCIN